jgi:putative transposase
MTERTIGKSRFSEPQIAFVLKQAEDGPPIRKCAARRGFPNTTFDNWRGKYAGLLPSG